jgi:hypothetical protein
MTEDDPLKEAVRGVLSDYRVLLGIRIRQLPEDGANKSRDAGRGYAQAIQDVLELLEGRCSGGDGRTGTEGTDR